MSVDAGNPSTADADQSVISITSARPRSANGRFMRVVPSTHGEVGPGGLPEDRFLDREISWLQFNERVLQLAEDPQMPLLERARFLAIFASNLDEFFMVRVAGLKRRIATGHRGPRAPPAWSRARCWSRSPWSAQELMAMHAAVFQEDVRPALVEEGIVIVRWDELAEGEQDRLHGIFREQVFPVLTPLAVDPAHPFPYISGLSLNLAVVLRQPEDRQGALRPGQGAAAAAPLHPRSSDAGRGLAAGRPLQHPVRPARGHHRRAPGPALPGHGGP